METGLCELYLMLPSMAKSDLYIPGYTEALQCVEGVRVVPDCTFEEAIPFKFRRFFGVPGFPCYYIPIKMGVRHFGFILKGRGKSTSRLSSYYPFFNLDALLSPKPYVFVVEGIKDAGMFLLRGEPVMGMLTSGMSEDMSKVFQEFQKTPIFVQDNDAAGDVGMRQMAHHMKKIKQPFFHVKPSGHKDMGDFFDHPELRFAVEATYAQAASIATTISGAGSFLRRATYDGLTQRSM